jgi:hypothetical protein
VDRFRFTEFVPVFANDTSADFILLRPHLLLKDRTTTSETSCENSLRSTVPSETTRTSFARTVERRATVDGNVLSSEFTAPTSSVACVAVRATWLGTAEVVAIPTYRRTSRPLSTRSTLRSWLSSERVVVQEAGARRLVVRPELSTSLLRRTSRRGVSPRTGKEVGCRRFGVDVRPTLTR